MQLHQNSACYFAENLGRNFGGVHAEAGPVRKVQRGGNSQNEAEEGYVSMVVAGWSTWKVY